MRKIGAIAILAALALPGAASAQVSIDMSQVTCGQYLSLPPDDARLFSAWMSGWFSQKRGYGSISLENHATNVANMVKWCGMHKNAKVMSALEQFSAPKQ